VVNSEGLIGTARYRRGVALTDVVITGFDLHNFKTVRIKIV